MNPLEFKIGELVKLGPCLWGDVYCDSKNFNFSEFDDLLANKIAMYVELKINNKVDNVHKVLYDNMFYFITDNSVYVDEDKKRNLQKVEIDEN